MTPFILNRAQPVATGANASGTYTVTANRYAWVSVTVQNGGSATLNGTQILDSTVVNQQLQNVVGVDVSTGAITSASGSTSLYTVASDHYFEGMCCVYSTSGTPFTEVSISGARLAVVTASGANSANIPVRMADGQAISAQVTGAGTAQVYLTGTRFEELAEGNQETPTANSASFWAKAGDAIAISGNANIVYSEWDIPS